MTATIRIKLFATLKAHEPENAAAYPIAPATTVSELVERLAVPGDMVKLIFVNSRRAALDTPLKDGDKVGIFPPVGGG